MVRCIWHVYTLIWTGLSASFINIYAWCDLQQYSMTMYMWNGSLLSSPVDVRVYFDVIILSRRRGGTSNSPKNRHINVHIVSFAYWFKYCKQKHCIAWWIAPFQQCCTWYSFDDIIIKLTNSPFVNKKSCCIFKVPSELKTCRSS